MQTCGGRADAVVPPIGADYFRVREEGYGRIGAVRWIHIEGWTGRQIKLRSQEN
jgi:hypothetical protein